jgi:hypothetical protein
MNRAACANHILRCGKERKDISSTDGCMGINALCEFGLQDQEVLQAMQGQGQCQSLAPLLIATKAGTVVRFCLNSSKGILRMCHRTSKGSYR